MPICTENEFGFLHCDWQDVIPLFYHVIIQFQDLGRQKIYVNNDIFTILYVWSPNVKLIKVHNFREVRINVFLKFEWVDAA